MFAYLLMGSFGEYFLFYGLANLFIALAWRHRFLLSKILSASLPGVWREILPHLFTRTSLFKTLLYPEFGMRLRSPRPLFQDWFSLPLFPQTERRCHFHFRVLANRFASIFLLPLSGDSLGPLSLSPGHRVQTSVSFHSDLDLLLRLWGIDLYYYSSF